MSGPKIIRVVTREELLARALDQIATLERAVERYSRFGRSHDVNLSAEIAAHRNAIAELKALTQTNAWETIARRSTDIARTVEHARKDLEGTLIAAATKDRTIRRRLKDAARAIQRETQALNLPIPGDLEDVIANAEKATTDQLKRMDAAIVAASRALVQHTIQSNPVESALAQRLATGLIQENYTDWFANNPVGREGQKSVRLDKILAELQLRDVAMTDPLAAAVHRIQEADDEERDLLIDSLVIELGDVLKIQRQRCEELVRLESSVARLERDGSREAQALAEAMRASLSSGNTANLLDWEKRTEETLKGSRAKTNAVHQRKALLAGLTALGYEVREGMATALVENGRLIVKKPAESEYGVEIVSSTADGRLQVRMVSFQSAPNQTRDKDIEVIWCGEVSELQAGLGRAGHTLNLEKALAPGAVPMKREQLPPELNAQSGVGVKQPLVRSI
jgi:hypothetical protein